MSNTSDYTQKPPGGKAPPPRASTQKGPEGPAEQLWDLWKQGFDAWENATANYLEHWLKSPLLLGPSGQLMSAVLRAKASTDDLVAQAWAAVGLPTRRDQERALHQLNELSSRIMDIEESLADHKAQAAPQGPSERIR